MGCLTKPYTPVETTSCFLSVCTRTNGDKKALSEKARKKRKKENINSRPPKNFKNSGKEVVHPNLFASSGIITIQPKKPTARPYTTYLSHPFWSPVPGFLYLSANSAGFLRYR